MTRIIQLFHDASKRREYLVHLEDQSIRFFVFANVEELKAQDPSFFQVYSDTGELISDEPVKDHPGPYFVSIDIISADARGAITLSRRLSVALMRHLRSADDVELCGLLLGRRSSAGQEFMVAAFPPLAQQTRNYVVINSRMLFLFGRAIENARLLPDEVAFGWVHTHLDSPPRLSPVDLGTLTRLRLLHRGVIAMVFNKRHALEGLATYDSEARPIRVIIRDAADTEPMARTLRDEVCKTFEAVGIPPPMVLL
jgi:proteasome lid subunit RPN8/RPN11